MVEHYWDVLWRNITGVFYGGTFTRMFYGGTLLGCFMVEHLLGCFMAEHYWDVLRWNIY